MGKPRKKAASFDPVFTRVFQPTPSKGELRRYQIVQAAIEHVAEHGVENTTFESVGKRLGIRRSHVSYYFASLDELVDTAIRYITISAQEALLKELSGAKTWMEQLLAYVDGNFNWRREQPEQAMMTVYVYHRGARGEASRETLERIRAGARDRLSAILRSGEPGKRWEAARVERVAEAIHSVVTGQLLWSVVTPSGKSLERLREETRETVRALAEAG